MSQREESFQKWVQELGLSQLEQRRILEVYQIANQYGDSNELQQACRRAYEDCQNGLLSSDCYNRIYSICMEYAYPR